MLIVAWMMVASVVAVPFLLFGTLVGSPWPRALNCFGAGSAHALAWACISSEASTSAPCFPALMIFSLALTLALVGLLWSARARYVRACLAPPPLSAG